MKCISYSDLAGVDVKFPDVGLPVEVAVINQEQPIRSDGQSLEADMGGVGRRGEGIDGLAGGGVKLVDAEFAGISPQSEDPSAIQGRRGDPIGGETTRTSTSPGAKPVKV